MTKSLFSMVALTWILFPGCGTIKVKSFPPADVHVEVANQRELKPLGKTPLVLEHSAIRELVESGPLILQIKKDGFEPKRVLVPNMAAGELVIEATLDPAKPSDYREVNQIVSKVLQAERLLLEKRYDEALQLAEEIKKINENVASAFEIEGTAYYNQNEPLKSRFAWLRVLELEPNNMEAQKILEHLETQMTGNPQ